MTTAKFKLGQKVNYLGYSAVITKVNDQYGMFFYNVSYDNGNGLTKATNVHKNTINN